jgi:hypothetical protein
MDVVNDKNEAAILNEILEGISELMADTRRQRKDLDELGRELHQNRDRQRMSDFRYAVDKERLRRSYQDVNYCLKSLERQRKIALQKLTELGL